VTTTTHKERKVHMHSYFNLPRHICQHLLGKDHQAHHRMTAGATLMVVGVFIAQGSHLVEIVVFKATIDLIGYSFHGLGLVPFLEWLLDNDKEGGPPPSANVCEPSPRHRAQYDALCSPA